MKDNRTYLVVVIASLVWAALTAMSVHESPTRPVSLAKLALVNDVSWLRGSSIDGDFPPLDGATGWLNSSPLTPEELRGKVVLIEFWTYTCINWRREYPYVRAWAAKYRDQGLVVIGVHSPEFAFEKDIGNVTRAARDIDVTHPIAVDSNHGIWRAFGNAYWPALYFIDAKGRVRHHHHGEGDYDQSERVIQRLLTEAGAVNVPADLVASTGTGAEAPPDWDNLGSPENYVGYSRTSNLRSWGAVLNRSRIYGMPSRLSANEWGLAGEWTLREDLARLDQVNGRIGYGFHARDLHLVMGPGGRGMPVRFRVTLDGRPPGPARGQDVDEQGNGTLSEPRMYQLIRQPGPIKERRFEIEFLDSGAEVFAFTFG